MTCLQYLGIQEKVGQMIDAAGAMGVNVICLQEAWSKFEFDSQICHFLSVKNYNLASVVWTFSIESFQSSSTINHHRLINEINYVNQYVLAM